MSEFFVGLYENTQEDVAVEANGDNCYDLCQGCNTCNTCNACDTCHNCYDAY